MVRGTRPRESRLRGIRHLGSGSRLTALASRWIVVAMGIVFLRAGTAQGAFGDLAATIDTPFTPFALTYVPEENYLVAVQYVDGQAARYRVRSAQEIGSLEPIFSPISEGHVPGIAWCNQDQSLYWLQELPGTDGPAYRLVRTTVDGFAVGSPMDLEVPAGTTLGDMTYVPETDAFWSLDVVEDRYLAFSRETGELLDAGFSAPLRHPDSGFTYGLGLDYVPVGQGQLDLLLGKITDLRALRVIRVDMAGAPVGVSYVLHTPSDENRPGWPTGIAYCRGEGGHFTAIADGGRDRILLLSTPVPPAIGPQNVTATVQEAEISGQGGQETIMVNLSWTNAAAYDNVLVELYDPQAAQFVTIGSAGPGETTFSHALNREGVFLYRLTGMVGGAATPPVQVQVIAGSGKVLRKSRAEADQSKTSSPFAVTVVQKETITVYVAEVKARPGEQAAVVHRFQPDPPSAQLNRLSPINSPFTADTLTVGLTWDSAADELVWLGQKPDESYVFARTDLEGTVTQAAQPLLELPFPRATLGDLAYDPVTGLVWTIAFEPQIVWAFDGTSGEASQNKLALPSTLPGRSGTWGKALGLTIAPGSSPNSSIFYVGMGKLPAVEEAPELGAGYVSLLVPLLPDGNGGFLVVGTPVPIAAAVDSAQVRGFAVTPSDPTTTFVACQDVGWVYEISVVGEGPLFARGDVNGDGQLGVADVVSLLQYLFAGGGEPPCLDAADVNDSGALNLSDGLYLLRHLFGFLPESYRAAPFGLCGTDPNTDSLSCLTPPACK